MITRIKFTEQYVCFEKGQKFDLKPLTLLVGDQGCGKSTMLDVLAEAVKEKKNGFVATKEGYEPTKLMKLDLERDNPRTSQGDPFNSKGLLYSMSVRYQSHGEVLVPILKLVDTVEDSYILLDEPETSLSLRSQFQMVDIFRNALRRNNQIVLATHNLLFMEAFPDCVLSLEHKKYLTPNEFVKLEMKPSDFKEKRDDKMLKKTKCKMGNACKCANETCWYNNTCEHYVNQRGANGRSYVK